MSIAFCSHCLERIDNCQCEDDYPHIYGQHRVDEIRARSDERSKVLAVAWKLLNLYGDPRCSDLHHSKKHRHGSLEDCPVEIEINELRAKLEEMGGKK